MDNFQKLKEILKRPMTITLIGHRNPDGDAMGSALALKSVLEQVQHRVYAVMPSEFPSQLFMDERSAGSRDLR